MVDASHRNPAEIALRLREQAAADHIRVTIHGHQEMVAEDISYEVVGEVLQKSRVIENYPDHQRGPCCLVCAVSLPGGSCMSCVQRPWTSSSS